MREIKRKLTDSIVRNLKPKDKAYKVSDGGRMFILVKSNGSKYWQYNYDKPVNGTHHIGAYPLVSLKDARAEHERAREQILNGVKPDSPKRQATQKNDFNYFYNEWLSAQQLAESTLSDLKQRMQKNILPFIGHKPIESNTTLSLLKILTIMADRGAIESAKRIANVLVRVFDRPLILGFIESNPANRLSQLLPKPDKSKKKNFAHIDNPDDLAELMRAIYKPRPRQDYCVTQALKLMPLVFLRPANIRFLKWENINWEEKRIYYSIDDMKSDKPFIVPLCTQAIEILKEVYCLTGRDTYVFSTTRGKGNPMSENTTTKAIQTLKSEKTGELYGRDFITSHGFRHTASTLLNEMLLFDKNIIEVQLAHLGSDKIKMIYDKAKYLPTRAEMMQTWANYVDGLRHGADVVPINKKA